MSIVFGIVFMGITYVVLLLIYQIGVRDGRRIERRQLKEMETP